MALTGTPAPTVTAVVAEDAPLGVCLWPVRDEKYAPNFTLASVAVVRDCNGVHVVWTYENGNARHFWLGETVACSY